MARSLKFQAAAPYRENLKDVKRKANKKLLTWWWGAGVVCGIHRSAL
jgi:hypothetical protein